MEDLRFLLPITAGKRPEVDSIATQAEAETSEKLDFRDFLADSYSETANVTNDGLKTGLDISSGAAGQSHVLSEKISLPVNTSQTLAIHARSKEIGRVIFTGDHSLEDKAPVDMESLNAGADALLSRFIGDASGSSKAMVDHIRETMLGATEVASNISKASLGGELNNDQLSMLKSSQPNSSFDFTQQIIAEPSRSLVGMQKLTTNEPQFFSVGPDLSAAETGGTTKEHLTSSMGQSADLAKNIKPLTMDFVTEPGSSEHESIQASLNGSRGEAGDQGGNQRDSEKQLSDGRPPGSEGDRQDWRERFAEMISDRIKIKVDEGEWLVKMSLQAAGLGSFDVSLKADDKGIFGLIRTDDPQVKELLNSALPELERALHESLSSAGEQKVRLELLESNSQGENRELEDAPEIIISASELTNSLPEGFKAGDGLDVFV
jgi:hypothetical protein